MLNILDIIKLLDGSFIPLVKTMIIVLFAFIFIKFFLGSVKKKLLAHATTKKQITTVEIFTRILKYSLTVFVLFFSFFSYSGSWASFGITLGLISAALGFALQKPIAGLVAWAMLIVKRPFEIGDRIFIGGVRGDVRDITLTHVYLDEIGHIGPGEEHSGRIVMVPNYQLFEQNITNYTLQDEYILGQVLFTMTYESSLDHALAIALDAAKKHTKDWYALTHKEPYTRVNFQASGVDVYVRYFAPAKGMQQVTTDITKEIYTRVKQSKNVEMAYPHTEMIIKGKKRGF